MAAEYDEIISLCPNKRALYALVAENRELKERINNMAVVQHPLMEENEFLKQMLTIKESQIASKNQKLAQQQQIINDHKNVHMITVRNTNEQRELNKLQEKLEISEMMNKSLHAENTQMKAKFNALAAELCNEIREVKKQNELLIQEKKTLNEENICLQSKLRELADACESSLNTIRRQGRFQVNRKCIECEQCHQAFRSHAEMQASQCLYHPVNPSPTDNSRSYFWKCCQVKAVGKSAPGCKKGRHVPKCPITELT